MITYRQINHILWHLKPPLERNMLIFLRKYKIFLAVFCCRQGLRILAVLIGSWKNQISRHKSGCIQIQICPKHLIFLFFFPVELIGDIISTYKLCPDRCLQRSAFWIILLGVTHACCPGLAPHCVFADWQTWAHFLLD